MTTEQTEALSLADWLDAVGNGGISTTKAAAELRRQHTRITELESQLAQRFDAADMATAAAQGFRDGVASVSAGSEPVTNNRPSLEEVFRRLSDRAYCNYIEQIGRDACLGWEHKAAHGKFGEAELKGHTVAGEMLGRHKAFAEAANALRGSGALLTYPSHPQEGMAGQATAAQQGAYAALPECLTCSDHGAVGNILTAEPCPDCTRLNAQPAPAQPDSVLEDAARYRWLREGNDAKHGAAWQAIAQLEKQT
jgi:hypothetical protein